MTEPDELARQIRRLNKEHICILQLIWDNYSLKIEPGTTLDIEDDTLTFKLSVIDNKTGLTVAVTENHIFDEALAEVYGSTPER